MKKIAVLLLAIVFTFYFVGCGKTLAPENSDYKTMYDAYYTAQTHLHLIC